MLPVPFLTSLEICLNPRAASKIIRRGGRFLALLFDLQIIPVGRIWRVCRVSGTLRGGAVERGEFDYFQLVQFARNVNKRDSRGCHNDNGFYVLFLGVLSSVNVKLAYVLSDMKPGFSIPCNSAALAQFICCH